MTTFMTCPRCLQPAEIERERNSIRLQLNGLGTDKTYYFCSVCEEHMSKQEYVEARNAA